jgi:ATP-dependent DNA helicase RecG
MVVTFSEIKRWIVDWESPTSEFKTKVDKEVGKTICAFANSSGGTIVFGVNAKKELLGIRDTDEESKLLRSVLDSCKPRPNMEQSFVKDDAQEKTLIAVKIEPFPLSQSACFFEGRCYVRQGTTNIRLEAEDLISFLKNRAVLDFEEQKTAAKLDDINLQKLGTFFKLRDIPEENLKGDKLKRMLAGLHVANYDGDFYIKNVALMFFAKDPKLFFTNLEVRVVKYSGVEPALDKIEFDNRLEGTIPELIEKTFILVSANIGKQYTIVGTKREELITYPENALREVITNALGHRDYFNTQCVLIEIFQDRMQVTNPGGLLYGQTIKNWDKTPQHRNPICYQMLQVLGYGEGLGLGIRLIRKSMREHGMPDPEFNFLGNSFRIILYNERSSRRVLPINFENERQKQALSYLKEKHTIKSAEYAKMFSVSQPTATNDLNELVKQGKIKKVGKYRGAYYSMGAKT